MRELSMHILDLLQNAVEADSTVVELEIDQDRQADRLTISVRDDGRGMEPEVAQRALDPFFTTRTTRHVGLGLPLLAAAARRCDGGLTLDSTPGLGTRVVAEFRHSHLDRAPLGNMADTLLAFLLNARGQAALRYRHRVDGVSFELDTDAIQAELGEVPLSHPRVRDWLREYIREGEEELRSPRSVNEGG